MNETALILIATIVGSLLITGGFVLFWPLIIIGIVVAASCIYLLGREQARPIDWLGKKI